MTGGAPGAGRLDDVVDPAVVDVPPPVVGVEVPPPVVGVEAVDVVVDVELAEFCVLLLRLASTTMRTTITTTTRAMAPTNIRFRRTRLDTWECRLISGLSSQLGPVVTGPHPLVRLAYVSRSLRC